MNNKYQMMMQEAASQNGLRYDEESGMIHGISGGYQVALTPAANNMHQLYYTVDRMGTLPEKKVVSGIVKLAKPVKACAVNGRSVILTLRLGSKKKIAENLQEVLRTAAEFFRTNGYTNCCQFCGEDKDLSACICGGTVALCCDACYEKAVQNTGIQQQAEQAKSENVLAGTAGAFVGSLIGAVVIVILGQLGYVAVLSGIVTAVCTLKGYEMLGGRLSKKGIIISCVIMALAIYLGNRADWAIAAANYFELDILSSFGLVPVMVSEGYIDAGTYYANLGLVYLFAVLGAAGTIPSMLRSRKMRFMTKKIEKQ